jgi:hypothetical protein
VITESSDGSHNIAREAAQVLGGHVLEVPRGLYQAWNSGIALATGEFIYISTIGDTITPEGLNALSVCIRKNEADVVFSPPEVFPATQPDLKRCRHWTVFEFSKILNQFSGVRIPKEKAILMQILSGATGLLGSCASCLFRTSFLKARPFSDEYHHYGDTAWTYKNLPDAILAFHPEPVARFVIHDQNTPRIVDKRQIYRLTEELMLQLPLQVTRIVHEYIRASLQIDTIRDPHPKFGWWWNPKAWLFRITRESSKNKLLQILKGAH